MNGLKLSMWSLLALYYKHVSCIIYHIVHYMEYDQKYIWYIPPGDGHGSLPRPLWEWVGGRWVGMLVDGVVVFANGVESFGICKEFD